MVALIVILFPPLLIAFLLVMERVEEPLRRPTSQGEVAEFLGSATPGEVGTLAHSGIRRAMARWRRRRRPAPGAQEAFLAHAAQDERDGTDPADTLLPFPPGYGDPAETARLQTRRPPVP